MRAEHLGYHVRILQFLERDAVDQYKQEELRKEFNLADKWAQFERKYLDTRLRSSGSDAPKLDVNRGFASAGRHTERNEQP